jgi:hypothetical protein
MGKWILVVVGGISALTGISVLTNSECRSISFDGQGGRAASVQCFETNEGALPGPVAGLGILLFGGLVASLPFISAGKPKKKRQVTAIPKYVASEVGNNNLYSELDDKATAEFLAGLEIVRGRVDGWFGDPSKRSKLRYFKGGRWTTATSESESPEEKRIALYNLTQGRLDGFFKNVKAIDVTGVGPLVVESFSLSLHAKKIPHERNSDFVFFPAENEADARELLMAVKANPNSVQQHASESRDGVEARKNDGAASTDRIGQLERLKILLDGGVLTSEEFAKEKRRVLES